MFNDALNLCLIGMETSSGSSAKDLSTPMLEITINHSSL
jgi:hypothetical protein